MMTKILETSSYSNHSKPRKLMILLHGYGDTASNLIPLAQVLDQESWGMYYAALNAPDSIPGYPMGFQWFDLNISGVHISNAGPKEYEVIRKVIDTNIDKIVTSISEILKKLNLEMKDCFVMGFSQGGTMTFELGRSLKNTLAGVGIISSRIITKDYTNELFEKTPVFISHGGQDHVIPLNNYERSLEILKESKFNFEHHLIENDEHTMSEETITLFQNFVKKNI